MSPEGQEERAQRTTISDWVGELVVLTYAGGPELADLGGNVLGVAKGPIEARLGIFGLHNADPFGVMVQKVTRGKDDSVRLSDPVFMPWASVLSVDPLTREGDESKGE